MLDPITCVIMFKSLHLNLCSLTWEVHILNEVKRCHSVVSDSFRPHGLYVAYQDPQSLGFSRQEYWSGLPFPSPGDLPDPGIEPISLMSPALAGEFFTATWKSWVRKIPWRREWQPTPVFLPGKSQGLRSLAGYSSWGRKELDATEQLILLLSLSFHYLSLMDWLYREVRHEKPWNFNSLIIYQHPSDEFPKPKSPECFILFWWWLCGHQKKTSK